MTKRKALVCPLRGLFKWEWARFGEAAILQTDRKDTWTPDTAVLDNSVLGWRWQAEIGGITLHSKSGAFETMMEARAACEREVIAYLKGKMAEGPGDTK